MSETEISGEFLKEVIKKCVSSPKYFIEKFGKIQHPQAGIIDFKLFSYQDTVLKEFKKHRFSIFKKTRQCGISTLTGIYALWIAMFHSNKTVLIVSKRDKDAKAYLRRNVKFVLENLPSWLKDQFLDSACAYNEHTIEFKNGSRIQSLTSSDDTLRSNSASLVILDEAAFMQHMSEMWAAGQSTLMQGGKVIVISTTNGVGNWYWSTWVDALNDENDFHPIKIDWWDMDWVLEFYDKELEETIKIAPIEGIRPCETHEELEKYGPYWSPWLEGQYRALQSRGETSKFRQEILAEFVGTGNTVIEASVLRYIGQQQEENKAPYKIVRDVVDYVDEFTQKHYELDFDGKLWLWELPQKGRSYSMGFDISGGDARDYTAIVVWDVDERRQVAELNIKVRPSIATRMAVWVGRKYNNATMVVDRSGMGEDCAKELEQDILYQNLWRDKKKPKDRGKVGLNINPASKPRLNKVLRDNLGMDGFEVLSPRLYKQLLIYINMGNGRTGAENGLGNSDDIVIAAGLGLLGGISDQMSGSQLSPFISNSSTSKFTSLYDSEDEEDGDKVEFKNPNMLMPMSMAEGGDDMIETTQDHIARFSSQMINDFSRKKGETPQEWKDRLHKHIPATRNKTEKNGQNSATKTIRLKPKTEKPVIKKKINNTVKPKNKGIPKMRVSIRKFDGKK